MLNRRHIRKKVMQSIYSMHQTNSDALEKEEKFLIFSIENSQDLYLTLVAALIEIQKKEIEFLEKSAAKHLATKEEKNPNRKFVSNKIFTLLAENTSISQALKDRKINVWELNDDYIQLILKAIKSSELYANYMEKSTSTFEEDKNFIVDLYSEVIAPNEKLYDYLEDSKLTWVDDIPMVNTEIVRQLNSISEKNNAIKTPKLYKDEDDKQFALDLFRKTVLNETEFAKEYADKTPNWDVDRIAEIDTILLKMAICEFLKFPSIPTKVTINEYLEIAKEYSTPKSSIFINGVLDNLVKEMQQNNRFQKIGRGLL